MAERGERAENRRGVEKQVLNGWKEGFEEKK